MKAKLYYLVRKVFSQKFRSRLKLIRYDVSKKISPWKKRWYGQFNSDQLKNELLKQIPDNYDFLMVHSSFSTMLPMYTGNIKELVGVLTDIAGKDKTLVMPAFFFGERKYNYDIRSYFKDKPYFYVDKMPSQMGMITEVFRKYPGVKVSNHPTHRISALGPMSEYITEGHEKSRTGCGQGSPFVKMAEGKTVILGLGVKYYQCMTQTHSVEDVLIEKGAYPTGFESIEIPLELRWGADKKMPYKLLHPDKSEYQRKLHPMVRNALNNQDLFEWKYKGVWFFYADAGNVQSKLINVALQGLSAYHK